MVKKENDEIRDGITCIRRSQIISSFDAVFMIIVPIITLVSGYITAHPEIFIGFDPQIIYTLVGFSLVFPIIIELCGILLDSLDFRLAAWGTFFMFGIFSYLNYSLVSFYQRITGVTLMAAGSSIYFLYGMGSIFIGFAIGFIVFQRVFLEYVFLPRMKEVGMPKLKWFNLEKTPDRSIYAFFIIGCIFALIGMFVTFRS